MKDAVEIARELIQIESTNPGVGEQEVLKYIQDFLIETGVNIELDEVEPGRYNMIATISSNQEFIEEREERDETIPVLVLICHMDTVVVGEGWKKDPFGAEVQDGRIYGRGACDMKSGLACALSVFGRTAADVKEGRRKLLHPLRLICTVDEEGFMTGVEHIIQKNYVKANDWVMDLEPTDGQIQMAHKGRFWITLSIHGITAHASRPEQGADAIAAAAEIICEMRNAFDSFPTHLEMGKSSITFGQIQGGYQPYVVPDECNVWIDCRLVPPADDRKVLQVLERAVERIQKEMPGIYVGYEITGNRPYIEINENSKLLMYLKEAVKKVTGKKLDAGVFPGYTDTAVIAGRLMNKECMSYGPGSLKYAHKPDEFVEIEDIKRCENVLMELIKNFISVR
ncbi:MAG: M20 family metallopeptidase [Dorea sp.]